MGILIQVLTHKWLGPGLIALMLVFSALVYSDLPEQVPTKFDLDGEVVSTTAREIAALIMPVVSAGILGLFVLIPKIDPRAESYEQFGRTFARLKNIIIAMLFGIHVLLLTRYDDPDSITRMILLAASIMMLGLANELPRIRPTWFVGVRTPWTLSSDSVWRETHRVGGQALFVVSLANIVAILVLSPPAGVIFFTATIIAVFGGIVVYSYMLWRREQEAAGTE